jgi:hypothetical protein
MNHCSFWYGGDRPRWLGPLPYDYPEHLTGEYPGDYGFDIAGLGRDPIAFANYFKYVIAVPSHQLIVPPSFVSLKQV